MKVDTSKTLITPEKIAAIQNAVNGEAIGGAKTAMILSEYYQQNVQDDVNMYPALYNAVAEIATTQNRRSLTPCDVNFLNSKVQDAQTIIMNMQKTFARKRKRMSAKAKCRCK